ncbi:hypothetical protein GCM10023317_88930 [Actinopolymorpha pittospori]
MGRRRLPTCTARMTEDTVTRLSMSGPEGAGVRDVREVREVRMRRKRTVLSGSWT